MRVMSQEVDGSRIPELAAIARHALEVARNAGASEAEADVSLQKGLTATVRLGEVDTVEYQRDRGLGVTVYFGKRKGSASTADLREAAVEDTVAKACAIARHTAQDDCSGLADPEDLAREIPELDLDHPWAIEPEQAIEIARTAEDAGRAVDPRITNSEGSTISTHRGVRLYANSHGFLGGYPSTSHSLSVVLLAEDGGGMQRDYWYASSRNAAELEAPEAVGRRAGERAVARLGARRMSTRKSPILFAPEVARGFVGHFLGAIRGGSQYRKSTFLLGAAGQQVFPEFVEMQERPHLRGAVGSSPFDAEGVTTRDRELVTGGVVQGYVLSSYSARKLGLRTTGNADGIHNLLVTPTDTKLDQPALLARMGTGLYVTELMGQGVNPVTGDYSRGATGFWIEGGAVAFPVQEVTIAGNLRNMYRHIVGIGSDVDARGAVRIGSVLLEEMTIAGE
jgi:PmbA protein